jgi:hypothetical protein
MDFEVELHDVAEGAHEIAQEIGGEAFDPMVEAVEASSPLVARKSHWGTILVTALFLVALIIGCGIAIYQSTHL